MIKLKQWIVPNYGPSYQPHTGLELESAYETLRHARRIKTVMLEKQISCAEAKLQHMFFLVDFSLRFKALFQVQTSDGSEIDLMSLS
jgi:hypothetical protein